MTELTRSAPAKINLTLHVLGRRPDGYHEIESLVAKITLCDTVTVAARDDQRWTLTCDDPAIPSDERNLAMQAVRRLSEDAGVRRGVHICIAKRIPAGAGLGGGSSNAATVLMLLNDLWGLRLSHADLVCLGAKIGSDVPAFLYGPICILRGRGEQVEEVAQPLSVSVVLFLPELHAATRVAYDAWDHLPAQPARPPLSTIIGQFPAPSRLAAVLFNDLQEAAFAAYPELARLAGQLRGGCGRPVHMTGSGAAFFCLCATPDEARSVACRVEQDVSFRVRVCPVAIQT